MKLIDTYEHSGEGFAPMFSNEKWQVAQINYDSKEDRIKQIDIHFETDELFVLLNGTAILIAADKDDQDEFNFEMVRMKNNIVYNVPRMTWHNIYLLPETKVLIFEDKGSHLSKYEKRKLTENQAIKLNLMIDETLKTSS